nr:hypothetical protein [Terriglobus aquaticus]
MLYAIPLARLDQTGNVPDKNTQGCAFVNRLKGNLLVASKGDGVQRTGRDFIQRVRGRSFPPSCGYQIQQGLPQASELSQGTGGDHSLLTESGCQEPGGFLRVAQLVYALLKAHSTRIKEGQDALNRLVQLLRRFHSLSFPDDSKSFLNLFVGCSNLLLM